MEQTSGVKRGIQMISDISIQQDTDSIPKCRKLKKADKACSKLDYSVLHSLVITSDNNYRMNDIAVQNIAVQDSVQDIPVQDIPVQGIAVQGIAVVQNNSDASTSNSMSSVKGIDLKDDYEFISTIIEPCSKSNVSETTDTIDISRMMMDEICKLEGAIGTKVIRNSPFSQFKNVVKLMDIDDIFLPTKIKCHTGSKYLESGTMGIIILFAILKSNGINVFELYNMAVNTDDVDIHDYQKTVAIRTNIREKNTTEVEKFDNSLVEDKFTTLKKRIICLLSTLLENKSLCHSLTTIYGPQRQSLFITNLLVIVGAHKLHPENSFVSGSRQNTAMKLIKVILHNTIFSSFRRNNGSKKVDVINNI